MDSEVKGFIYKFIGLVLATPFMAYGLLLCIDQIEKAWKTNNRKKKWIALCFTFFAFAVILGWLQ